MKFGQLNDIDLREAWPNEANNFTPWLAENLPHLAEAIGIPLELEGTEIAVEGYSADILATYPADGSRVIIENQLESTDHTHLGQIMTYLAGLEAKTVVWIARDFRGPHLSAIRWLNTHTTDDFAFFAVKLRVVQIGDNSSIVAPLFEVVERPNDWERRMQAVIDSGGSERLNNLRKFRRDFWQSYIEQYPNDLQLRPSHRDSNVYQEVEGVSVSLYIAQQGVGVFLSWDIRNFDRQDRGLARAWKNQECCCDWCCTICEKGEHSCVNCYCELCLGNDERYPITKEASAEVLQVCRDNLRIDSNNRDNWPQMIDWLHQKLLNACQALSAYAAL